VIEIKRDVDRRTGFAQQLGSIGLRLWFGSQQGSDAPLSSVPTKK
jgi:hypothetical protein